MEQIVKDTMRNLEQIAADSKMTKQFVEEMTLAEHRTHQQRIAKLLVAVFKAHAENGKKGLFDGRNQDTVQFAMKIQDAGIFDNTHFPFI